jgi:hypothetical protein
VMASMPRGYGHGITRASDGGTKFRGRTSALRMTCPRREVSVLSPFTPN